MCPLTLEQFEELQTRAKALERDNASLRVEIANLKQRIEIMRAMHPTHEKTTGNHRDL